MLRLSRLDETPPGGWHWDDPDSKKHFEDYIFGNLYQKALNHRRAMNYEVKMDFRDLVIEQNAKRVLEKYPDWHDRISNEDPPTIWEKATRFAGAMARFAIGGFKTVTEEELNRRKAICANCAFWKGTTDGFHVGCNKCGCSSHKLYLLDASPCPIAKW